VPRIVDHAQRREQILRDCFTLYRDCGFAYLSLREIAHGLDTTIGMMHHYFPARSDLAVALCEAALQWLLAERPPPGLADVASLDDRCDRILAWAREHEGFLLAQAMWTASVLAEEGSREGELAAKLQAQEEDFVHRLAKVMGLAPHTAIAALCVVRGAALQRHLTRGHPPLAAARPLLRAALEAPAQHAHDPEPYAWTAPTFWAGASRKGAPVPDKQEALDRRRIRYGGKT
jgi:AcrR family transcriptional regulator